MQLLYLVRHGECVANVEGVVAGAQDDSPLTKKGMDQANEIALKLRDYGFERIISSPLIRAKRTAEIIVQGTQLSGKIEIDERLIERNVGSATGLPLAEYFTLEKAGPIEGAESEQQMFDRISDFLEDLKKDPSEKVLLVAHNGTFRMLQCVLEGRPAVDFSYIEALNNGEVYEIEIG